MLSLMKLGTLRYYNYVSVYMYVSEKNMFSAIVPFEQFEKY